MFEIRSRRARVGLTVLLAVLVIPFVIPLFTMVQGSLQGIGWGNYVAVFQLDGLWLYFRNSIIISGATIALVYFLTMAASFGFSKLRIRNKELFFWLMMGALTMPEVVLLTPLVITASNVGLAGTFWAVILPLAALQIPFTTLLTRSYVDGIPDALFEAARIDGASTWRAFWSLLIPLAKPMAVAIVVLVLINSWNSYLLPLVMLGKGNGLQVVTQLTNAFSSQYRVDETKILAGAVVAALPEIVAYITLQRFFERGMSAGALK
jgi:raffinose/stachyose/melibiose transport system permease protein